VRPARSPHVVHAQTHARGRRLPATNLWCIIALLTGSPTGGRVKGARGRGSFERGLIAASPYVGTLPRTCRELETWRHGAPPSWRPDGGAPCAKRRPRITRRWPRRRGAPPAAPAFVRRSAIWERRQVRHVSKTHFQGQGGCTQAAAAARQRGESQLHRRRARRLARPHRQPRPLAVAGGRENKARGGLPDPTPSPPFLHGERH
jgi:hypothetical protein